MSTTAIQDILDQARSVDAGLELAVDDSWAQGRSWYGGLQLAFAIRAARKLVAAELPLRSVHGSYIGPIAIDSPAIARARILRRGRSVTQVQAELLQHDQIGFQCTAVCGAARQSKLNFNERPRAPFGDPTLARAFRFKAGVTPEFTWHYNMRWAEGGMPFEGAASPHCVILARPHAGVMDEAGFLGLSDVIPPPAISILDERGPISTISYALEIVDERIMDGSYDGWVQFDSYLHSAHSGYAWQTAYLTTEDDTLAAIAHQCVAVFV